MLHLLSTHLIQEKAKKRKKKKKKKIVKKRGFYLALTTLRLILYGMISGKN